MTHRLFVVLRVTLRRKQLHELFVNDGPADYWDEVHLAALPPDARARCEAFYAPGDLAIRCPFVARPLPGGPALHVADFTKPKKKKKKTIDRNSPICCVVMSILPVSP